MATGGFCFGKHVLSYDSSTNGATIRSWGLAVHKARCVAFMEAYNNEISNASGLGWTPVQTRGKESTIGAVYEITATSDGVSSSGQTYYIQDWASTGFDTNGEWPAFVSFFKYNGGSQEYCIITYRCMNCYTSWSDSTVYYNKGLYIHRNNLHSFYDSSLMVGQSYMHAFAPDGFNNYNIQSSNFLTLGATKIFPSLFSTYVYSTSVSDQTSYLVGRRSNGSSDGYLYGRSFKFGYAVKGDIIEVFASSSSTSSWLWGLIGNIFGQMGDDGDTYTCGCLNSRYTEQSDCINSSPTNYSWGQESINCICVCDKDGNVYDPNASHGYYCYCYNPFLPMSYMTSTFTPSDIKYNAIPIAYYLSGNSSPSNDPGIDGNGSGFKGFINTDCMRGVSGNLCQTFGSTMNNDKFIVTYSGSSPYGYILGWDPSNESLL